MANKKKVNNSLLLLALLGGGALLYKNKDKIKKLFGKKGTKFEGKKPIKSKLTKNS
mgnify:CR=1 FL=1